MHHAASSINTNVTANSLIGCCLEPIAYEVSRALEFALDAIELTLARRAAKRERRVRTATKCGDVSCAAVNFSSQSSVC